MTARLLYRCWRLVAAGLLASAVVGCASPRARPADAARADVWSGRLALIVASEPQQQFSAGFTLTGSPSEGELDLASPLGNTLARLSWAPGSARLIQGEQVSVYPSVDALSAAVTGTALPITTLFAWLNGIPQSVVGWQADLDRLNQDGRITARRLAPPPAAELRVILDR